MPGTISGRAVFFPPSSACSTLAISPRSDPCGKTDNGSGGSKTSDPGKPPFDMGVPQQRIVVLGLAFLSVAGFLITWRLTRRDHTSSSTRPVPSPESAVPGLEGSWEGALEVQNTSLRLVLKVSRAAEGGYSATLDSVDQGAKDLPVNAITLSNRLTRVELSSLLASYSALFD